MKKKALIVGINYEGTSNRLKGCLNDANNMKAVLEGRGFTEIKMVLEKEATTAGIIAGLEWLVSDTKPGDVIVFHYSGHGSQLPSSVEADGFEEIICPIDLNWMDKVITDDTLRKIFNKVPNGVNTTLVLDCCHSGTMLDQTESMQSTRAVEPKTVKTRGVKNRYLKPPAKIAKKLANRELVDWTTSRDVNATALLIAACEANQTSADALINGVHQGAGTASLIGALKADPEISYKKLAIEMNNYMAANKFSQKPQLDGSSSLYDQKFTEQFSFTIPADPVTTPDEDKPTDVKKGRKNILIAAAAIVIIAAIIFFVG